MNFLRHAIWLLLYAACNGNAIIAATPPLSLLYSLFFRGEAALLPAVFRIIQLLKEIQKLLLRFYYFHQPSIPSIHNILNIHTQCQFLNIAPSSQSVAEFFCHCQQDSLLCHKERKSVNLSTCTHSRDRIALHCHCLCQQTKGERKTKP